MAQISELLKGQPVTQCAFSYLADIEKYHSEKPYVYSGPLPPGAERLRTNIETSVYKNLTATDIRGHEDRLSLDQHGFKIRRLSQTQDELDVSKNNPEQYMQGLAAMMKQDPDCELALCYNCRVRPLHIEMYIAHKMHAKYRKSTAVSREPSSQEIGTNAHPDEPAETPHIG